MRSSASKYFALSTLAVVALTCSVATAQHRRRVPLREQTQFGSDTKIERPVKLSDEVVGQLFEAESENLKHCFEALHETRASAAKELSASEIDINGDGVRDLIVQGMSGCFIGAHVTGWWLFSKLKDRSGARAVPGYHLVFSGHGDGLRVLKTTAYGYRDIETVSFAAAGSQLYYTVWKFDGQAYKARRCTIEEEGRKNRVPCDE